jgi:hypothetical protein
MFDGLSQGERVVVALCLALLGASLAGGLVGLFAVLVRRLRRRDRD